MSIQTLIESAVKKGFLTLYNTEIPTVEFQATRKEFEGDITVVVFPMLRYKKGNPVQIGNDLGNYILENVKEVTRFNVVKGFLNLVIDDTLYRSEEHTSELQSHHDLVCRLLLEKKNIKKKKKTHQMP